MPFASTAKFTEWATADEKFRDRLRDLVAGSSVPALGDAVRWVGWGDGVRRDLASYDTEDVKPSPATGTDASDQRGSLIVESDGVLWRHTGNYDYAGKPRVEAECPQHRVPLLTATGYLLVGHRSQGCIQDYSSARTGRTAGTL
ncbi:MAG: hypothetical protein EXR65_02700 [Dehalococcoidia bacterium]|nr:hypothetical protein [Dehalococcoidia bacterium]